MLNIIFQKFSSVLLNIDFPAVYFQSYILQNPIQYTNELDFGL